MRKFESSLGADLSSVRVHADAKSQAAARSVDAKAYTVGQHIYFGAGEYAPSSRSGELLLAHEVAHTVQQYRAAPTQQNKLVISSPSDALELEADRAASSMVAGQLLGTSSAERCVGTMPSGRTAGRISPAPRAIARVAHSSSGFRTGGIGNWSYIAFLDQDPKRIRFRFFDSSKPEGSDLRQIGTIPWITNNPGNIRTLPGSANEAFSKNKLETYEKRPTAIQGEEENYRTFGVFASAKEGSMAIVPFLQWLISANPHTTMGGLLKIYRGGQVNGAGSQEQLRYVEEVSGFMIGQRQKKGDPNAAVTVKRDMNGPAAKANLEEIRPAIEFVEGSKVPADPAKGRPAMEPPPGVEFDCVNGYKAIDEPRYTKRQLDLITDLKLKHSDQIVSILGDCQKT
jgi:hypothetical protein